MNGNRVEYSLNGVKVVAFEIGNDDQQHRGNKAKRGNRQSKVFNTALRQPDDGDRGHDDQGQRH